MIIPTLVSSLTMSLMPLATGTTAADTPDMAAVNNTTSETSETSETNTTTNISTDNRTMTTSGMNALGMLLFWFFIVSTVFLVLGSLAVLRRLKRRDKKRLEEKENEKKAAKAEANGYYCGSDADLAAQLAAKGADGGDEEKSISGSTIPARASNMGATETV